VAGLDAEQWRLPTPAPGWTVADQVAHLAFIFRLAAAAATDGEAFTAMTAGAQQNFDGAVNAALKAYENDTPDVRLAKWRADRAGVRRDHGAVRARPGHRRRARRAAGPHRPAAAPGGVRGAHAGLRLPVARADPARRAVPVRDHRAVGRAVGVRPGGRREPDL